MPRSSLLLATSLLIGACGAEPPSEDPPQEAAQEPAREQEPPRETGQPWEMPAYAERALSNAYVSVYRYAVAPGDSVSMQEGTTWLVYADGGASLTGPAGAVEIAPRSARFFARPAVLRNAAADIARLVVVERTGNPLPDRVREDNPGVYLPDEAVQLNELGAASVQVLSEDGGVLASTVTLAPGETIPLHSGFSRVIYALSDYTVQRFGVQGFGGSGSDATATRKAGDALWNTASNFAVENVGDGELRALIVAYYE